MTGAIGAERPDFPQLAVEDVGMGKTSAGVTLVTSVRMAIRARDLP